MKTKTAIKKTEDATRIAHYAFIILCSFAIAIAFLAMIALDRTICAYAAAVVHVSLYFALCKEIRCYPTRARFASAVAASGVTGREYIIKPCMKNFMDRMSVRFAYSALGKKSEYKLLKRRIKSGLLDNKRI